MECEGYFDKQEKTRVFLYFGFEYCKMSLILSLFNFKDVVGGRRGFFIDRRADHTRMNV